MNSSEEKNEHIEKCEELTIMLHKLLKDGNIKIPKDLDDGVKKLIIQRVSKSLNDDWEMCEDCNNCSKCLKSNKCLDK